MNNSSEVLSVNEAFYQAFEKKDIEAMTAIWSQGIDSLCIHPGRNALRGWKEIRESWEKIFKNTSFIEIQTEVMSTDIRDNLAYVVLIETVLQEAGGRKVKAQSLATNVFEYMGGKWYLIHHHGSPIMR